MGVTLDYGPFGFLDRYDPDWICNTSDEGGRYTYARQPEICKWNCGKLAEALIPLMALEKSTEVLGEFDVEFDREYSRIMHRKFGLHTCPQTDR